MTERTKATGWAAIENGRILVRTVSDTKRAAMVNFLVTERNTFIYSETTDEEIERMWHRYKQGAEIDYVTISQGVMQ